jgi:hypothetical protein
VAVAATADTFGLRRASRDTAILKGVGCDRPAGDRRPRNEICRRWTGARQSRRRRVQHAPWWTSVDGPKTNWKCGIRGNSDRGFESVSLRRKPLYGKAFMTRELRPRDAIGQITGPTLTPTVTPIPSSVYMGGRPWTGYRISAQSAALDDQPDGCAGGVTRLERSAAQTSRPRWQASGER